MSHNAKLFSAQMHKLQSESQRKLKGRFDTDLNIH